MTIKVAINGYGRIGRNVLRAHYEGAKRHDIEIVAINDLGDPHSSAHLTRYDSAHGRFDAAVGVDGQHMVVNGDRIKVLACRDPAELPWDELGVDVVLDIGPASALAVAGTLQTAGTSVWNGPPGVFEMAQFAGGTRVLARAIAESPAFSIAGGGDTAAAIHAFGVAERIDYISTAGGAFLEFLEGKTLPAVAALERRDNA